ncbi:MAG: IS4 family transposase [Chloroflexota bacterium]|nr:IS4 family transposase [Chloroflexota bacterium]
MSVNNLYHTWMRRISQLRPGERINRLRNMVWLMVGIYKSKSVHLSQIALKIPGEAKVLSTVQRLRRFLKSPTLRVRDWYEPIARMEIEAMARTTGEVRLIADGTKVGFHHQLLMVAVAFRQRAIPIAWMWVEKARGHSSAHKQLALLAHVKTLVPEDVPVLLVGDSEFGAVDVIAQVDIWDWWYVLRQKRSHLIKLPDRPWQAFGALIQEAGESRWLGAGLLTAKYGLPTCLLAHWKREEEEPWLLATNLPSRHQALRAYRRRMWIEEMFGDMKGHGFDLESTHLRHFPRLSRLTLAVVLLYVWLICVGRKTIKDGDRHLVDRSDRRDLSLFQIGLRIVERALTNGLSIPFRLLPVYGYKL